MFVLVCALAISHSILNIRQARNLAEKNLIAVTQGVSETVDSWLREKKKQLQFLAESESVRSFQQSHEQVKNQFIALRRINQDLENVFLVDSGGRIRVVAYPETGGIDLGDFEVEVLKLEAGTPSVVVDQNIYRSPVSGNLISVMMANIPDLPSESGARIGFALDWDRFIEKFIIPVTVGKTGYVAITDEMGRNIAHPDRSLNLQDLSHLEFIRRMMREKNGFQRYEFSGVYKFMAYRQLRESGWIINASVNERELIEGAIFARNVILLVGVIILMIMLFIIGYVDVFRLGKAQKGLRDSQQKFKLIFDHGNDGIFAHGIDASGVSLAFTQVNGIFCELFLKEEVEILRLFPAAVFQVARVGAYEEMIRDVIDKKYTMKVMRLIDPHGRELHFEFRLFLLEIEGVTSVLGFVRDITEQVLSQEELRRSRDLLDKKVKERTHALLETNVILKRQIKERETIATALKESEEKYRNLVERANDGILVLQNWKIRLANRKMDEMLGYKTGELVGRDFLLMVPDDLTLQFRQSYLEILMEGKNGDVLETRLKGRDGKNIGVELNSGVILYEGEPADFVFVRDITERKRVEEKERIRQEQLVQTDKLAALGTLVSGVAHEINNPNNSIMLNIPIIRQVWHQAYPIFEEYHKQYGDFVLAGMPYTLVRKYIADLMADIESSSERIKVIVEDLKNFARPGDVELSEEVDVNAVVKAAVNLVFNLIHKSTSDFQVEYDNKVSLIRGNSQRLEQVMVNLIQNACHALVDKHQMIRVKIESSPDGNFVEVRVRDTGSGIKAGHLKKITDPFFTTKRDRGGTGLGLSVSLSIVKEHSGSLSFDSAPGKGTEVLMRLPVLTASERKST